MGHRGSIAEEDRRWTLEDHRRRGSPWDIVGQGAAEDHPRLEVLGEKEDIIVGHRGTLWNLVGIVYDFAEKRIYLIRWSETEFTIEHGIVGLGGRGSTWIDAGFL